MGSCVSVHKTRKLTAMKLHLSMGSKNDKFVAPSPEKEKPAEVTGGESMIANLALKSQWSPVPPATTFRDSGCKEETFFDSQPWLESDCEDDFYSVKGDFTPSRGSTPVHHSFSFAVGTPPLNRALVPEGTPSADSPSDKKKRLSELFEERLQVDHDIDEQNTAGNKNGIPAKTKAEATNPVLPPKSASGTPYASGANSGYSSERTPNVALIREEDKSMNSAECCIPRFRLNRSCNERKMKMSPAHSIK